MTFALIVASAVLTLWIGGEQIVLVMSSWPIVGDALNWYTTFVTATLLPGSPVLLKKMAYVVIVAQCLFIMLSMLLHGPRLLWRLTTGVSGWIRGVRVSQ